MTAYLSPWATLTLGSYILYHDGIKVPFFQRTFGKFLQQIQKVQKTHNFFSNRFQLQQLVVSNILKFDLNAVMPTYNEKPM